MPTDKPPADNPFDSWVIGTRRSADAESHLWMASRDAGRYALEHSQAQEPVNVLLSAVAVGVATETLLKWALVRINPLLLTLGTNRADSSLFMAGVVLSTPSSRKKTSRASHLTTIGALEAWELAHRMHPFTSVNKAEVEALLATRNAAAHLGLADKDELRISLRVFVALVDELIAQTEDATPYFDLRFADLLASLRRETDDAVATSFAAKVARAREYIRDTYGLLDLATQHLLMSKMEALPSQVASIENQIVECPACGRQAFAEYDEFFGPYEHGENGEILAPVTGRVTSLRCPICTLRLDADEVKLVQNIPEEQDWGIRVWHLPERNVWYDDEQDRWVDDPQT